MSMKKVLKKLNKIAKKGHIDKDFGSDGLTKHKLTYEIEFLSVSKKSKLFKRGKKRLEKFLSKKLGKKVFLTVVSKTNKEELYTLFVNKG